MTKHFIGQLIVPIVLLVTLTMTSLELWDCQEERDSYAIQAKETYLALLDQERINKELQAAGPLKIVELSYYCDCSICTGSNETTASGTKPLPGYTVAVDPDYIPLGSRIFIEGLGWRYAEDTGGSVTGYEIDVFVESHEKALQLGRHTAYAIVKV